jgi:hypothetical protein
MHGTNTRADKRLTEALDQLLSALQLLDSAAAPPQIGAHVDLAIHELHSAVARTMAGPAFTPNDRPALPQ